MPLVNLTNANPVLMRAPDFVLDYLSANPLHLICVTQAVNHNVAAEEIDVSTACDPAGIVFGKLTQDFTLKVLLTYGVNGSYNRLQPLANSVVTFSYLPEGGVAVGPNNPEFTGSVVIPPISVSAGNINSSTYVDIKFAVRGVVTPNYTTVPVYAGHHGIL
jgi:hypothetical protein